MLVGQERRKYENTDSILKRSFQNTVFFCICQRRRQEKKKNERIGEWTRKLLLLCCDSTVACTRTHSSYPILYLKHQTSIRRFIKLCSASCSFHEGKPLAVAWGTLAIQERMSEDKNTGISTKWISQLDRVLVDGLSLLDQCRRKIVRKNALPTRVVPMILQTSTGHSFFGAESMLSATFRNHHNVTAITSLLRPNQGGGIVMKQSDRCIYFLTPMIHLQQIIIVKLVPCWSLLHLLKSLRL